MDSVQHKMHHHHHHYNHLHPHHPQHSHTHHSHHQQHSPQHQHHHQRIHSNSSHTLPYTSFDSPPRHSPPHSSTYPYHQPYTPSTSSCKPCPHCSALPTLLHQDPSAGDLVCTQCGAVLDDHLRDSSAEWREYGNDEDILRGKVGGRRCGEVVDESKYVGGIMPTKLSSGVYNGGGGTKGFEGNGNNGSTFEERKRLQEVRNTLKRTHNRIENMVEKCEKERYAQVVLERMARDARVERGEDVENGEEMDGNDIVSGDGGEDGGGGMEHVVMNGGDYEGLMAVGDHLLLQRQRKMRRHHHHKKESTSDAKNGSAKSAATTKPTLTASTNTSEEDKELQALQSLQYKKWSLSRAILLNGTLEQVRQYGDDLIPSHTEEGGEWTDATLEVERTIQIKKMDAPTRANLQKMYRAYCILETAAQTLGLDHTAPGGGGGGVASNKTFGEAINWFVKFVNMNDGLRIKSISSSSRDKQRMEDGCTLSLSLFGSDDGGGHPDRSLFTTLSASSSTSALSTELHRLKQYAALSSAILYLAAKRTGVGRTLTEVCSAFGTYHVIPPGKTDKSVDEGKGGAGVGTGEDRGEALVRPKYCSRAMEELRRVLPEIVESFQGGGVSGAMVAQEVGGTLPSAVSSSDVHMKTEEDENDQKKVPAKVTPTYGSFPSVPTMPVKSEYAPNTHDNAAATSSSDTIMMNSEEAALADLTRRMATSLDLPSCAISAAVTVALQCARDAHATAKAAANPMKASPSNKSAGARHIRPRQRRRRTSGNNSSFANKQEMPDDDVVAIASIVLVCTAGGVMQRLARQALNCNHASGDDSAGSGLWVPPSTAATSTSIDNASGKIEEESDDFFAMSNPLDDLHHDLIATSKPPDVTSGNTTLTPTANTGKSSAPTQSSNNHHHTAQQQQNDTLSSWKAWNTRPSWHRTITQIERCTGVPRKRIISFYANALHPRRSYFLGKVVESSRGQQHDEEEDMGWLCNIVAAVPLMTLRNL